MPLRPVGPQPDMGLISKRREGCKIVLLRPAVTNSISCNARFRSVRDRTNLISYIDASSLDGLAVRQPRGHWRHTPSPAQSPSRQMFRRVSAAIGEPSSRNVYALQSLSALMISRVGGF